MVFGGWNKVSLVNYPGEIATVVFMAGCNLRCIYCHNMELALMDTISTGVTEDEVINYLKSRVGKITALVISGGEPLMKNVSELIQFINRVHKEVPELKVKVDTNGMTTNNLKALLRGTHIDYVAMDIKYDLWYDKDWYREKVAKGILINQTTDGISVINEVSSSMIKSIEVLMDNMKNSNLSIEFRTTCDKRLLNVNCMFGIIKHLNELLINNYSEDELSDINELSKIKNNVIYSVQKLRLDNTLNNLRFKDSLNLSRMVRVLRHRSKYIDIRYLND